MITLFENFYKKGLNITYSGVILDDESRNLLLSSFIYPNPELSDWLKICHHMTICLGELPEHLKRYWLGEEVGLTVRELGISDKAIAVKVTGSFVISKPNIDEGSLFQHITLAINPFDAKPADSNLIDNWQKVEPLKLRGVISEIQI
jgi:hypothetical protein